MAMIAACALEPGVYFAINSPAGDRRRDGRAGRGRPSPAGASRSTPRRWTALARSVGEQTLLNRTGGAPSLAVGMAHIFSGTIGGERLLGIWYHFAIMFEALFILTVLDAGTRVGRFMVQELLGRVWEPLGAHAARGPSTLVDERRHRGRLGLLPLPGRPRPARRHQLPVAALRHREPDPGLGRARGGHHHPHQDGARALRRGSRSLPMAWLVDGDPHRRAARRSSTPTRASASWPRRARSSSRSPTGRVPEAKVADTRRVVFNNRLDAGVTGALRAA